MKYTWYISVIMEQYCTQVREEYNINVTITVQC